MIMLHAGCVALRKISTFPGMFIFIGENARFFHPLAHLSITLLNFFTIRGTAVHAGSRIRTRNVSIMSPPRYRYRHGGPGIGGMGMASGLRSVANISR